MPERPAADLLIERASEVLTCVARDGDLLGRIEHGSVAVAGERIVAVGPADEVERGVDLARAEVVDARGCVVAPGFVDCHTHVVFGGSRVEEYAASVAGTLAERVAQGLATGIQATVDATRAATRAQLVEQAGERLAQMFRHGTTTVESKTGYGLDLATELRLLEVNGELAARHPPDVVGTFLGAHDLPRDMARDEYVALLVEQAIPQVAARGLAVFCDVYCDEGYYTVEETRAILAAGREHGLRPKLHADAYADVGAALLAAELGAVSADHLNYTPRAGLDALARCGVVAVAMPALDFAVAHPRPTDARGLLAAGLTLALATDLCPGCWVDSMQLVVALACRLYGLSPAQAIWSATAGAARALARDDRGALAPGLLADLQLWDVPRHEHVAYRIGANAVRAVVRRGRTYTF